MTLKEKIKIIVSFIDETDENEKRIIKRHQNKTYENLNSEEMIIVARLSQMLREYGISFGENNNRLLWNFLRLYSCSNFEFGELTFGEAMRHCNLEANTKESKFKKFIDFPDLLSDYALNLLERQIKFFYKNGLKLNYTNLFYDLMNWKIKDKPVQKRRIKDYIQKL